MSRLYTPAVLEHYRNPRNQGALPDPTVSHELLNPLCGDRIRVELALEGERVAEARFRGDACALCVAAASVLTDRIRGRDAEGVRGMDAAELLEVLQADVPESRMRCVTLPLEAAQAGLRGRSGG